MAELADHDRNCARKQQIFSKIMNRSPDRNTFQKESYIERCKQEGTEPNAEYLAMYERWNEMDREWAESDHSNENSLEWDLRTTDWILNKVRSSITYSQNLYAAMCNMQWQKSEVFPILKDDIWSCSWRYAGGIIADIRGSGDYLDWYCSGIGDGLGNGDSDGSKGYVPEGTITEEIADDLQRLGWLVLDADDR